MGHWFQLDKIVELLRPIILSTLIVCNCSSPAPSGPQAYKVPGGAPPDTLVVDTRAVVFFRQDSVRMEWNKAALNDRLFESLTHDCYFETRYVRSVIQRERPALPVVNVSANRWLVFKKKDGGRKAIDLHAINDICGVFLFDGIKDPIRADMPNIETQWWFYFGEGRN